MAGLDGGPQADPPLTGLPPNVCSIHDRREALSECFDVLVCVGAIRRTTRSAGFPLSPAPPQPLAPLSTSSARSPNRRPFPGGPSGSMAARRRPLDAGGGPCGLGTGRLGSTPS